MEDLRGKNAVITGASRGVGVYIARALAAKGVNVALVARTADQLARVAQDLGNMGVQAIDVPADVTVAADRSALVAEVERRLGQIDILVNNAAIIEWSKFEQEEPADIGRIIETNLMAPLYLTRMVLPGMVERRSGHIINIDSLAGKVGIPFEAAYAASKGGLLQWSSALRVELEDAGVYVTSVLPSYITEVGQWADTGLVAPRLAGAVSPRSVAAAVVQALRGNPPEIIVRSMPTRPLLALGELIPGIGARIMKSMGLVSMHRRLAERHERSF